VIRGKSASQAIEISKTGRSFGDADSYQGIRDQEKLFHLAITAST
jgi:hypothetical protein